MVTDYLNRAGYVNVISCENGQEAWEILQEAKAKNMVEETCRCVITDIEMPKMDGHRLLKLIRDDSALSHIPVIVFSSLVNEEMRRKGEALGATAQLSKPEIGNLVREVDKLVR